ncbi:sugar transferase [Streptomyces flavidovirens]|uniref:sugar transferase n=1 Tax=Streptomyces flavidovirens TaxID=67298 RepID=UPI0033A7B4C8
MLAKRVFDLAVTAALLPIAVPLLLLTATAAAVTSGGPVLVRETRAGLAGRPFGMLTLRTPVDGLLRRWRLDVLPRLIHVLRGEMSLVGPCALPPGHPSATRARLVVRPGITGLWQVGGRSELPWEEMDVLDLHYIEQHWLGLDLAVLARTIPAVLAARR